MTGFWVRVARRPVARVAATAVAFAVVTVGMPLTSQARSAGANATGVERASESTRPSETSDEARALAAARRLRRRVEVVSQRSETRAVFANPQGTLTLVESAQPVRVRRAGRWVPVDTSLRRRADGTAAPAAALADVRLSGGGDTPLVRLAHAGRELSFGWHGRLPKPTIAGDTATYPEVLPGVDLRVRVGVDGFSEVLVVKTRAAGRNPALSRVRLATTAKGVTVKAAAGGGLRVVDEAGTAVFSAGAPSMWDAAATQARGRHTVMRVEVGQGEIAVVPDRRLLSDPRTQFPVFIDPAVSLGLNRWGNVTLNAPDQRIVDDPFRGEGAKAGKACDPGCYQYRSLFAFGLSPVHGRHVLNATFAASLYHSWSCSDTPVELWITGGISDATTWNNSAGIWGWTLDTRWGHANYPTCGQPPMRMEFGGGLAGAAQQGANERWPELTLGLKAPNEGDVNQWKRFSVDGRQAGTQAMTLSIEYNSWPNTPDQLDTDGRGCVAGAGRPYLATTTPTLSARVSDPDAGQQLRGNFYWGPLGGAPSGSMSQGGVANGGTAVVKIPAGQLQDGGSYYWKLYVDDGINGSGWSASCEFTVDVTPPNPVKAISSTDYPPVGFHGVAGRTGRFTLTPPDVHPEDAAFYRVAQSPCDNPDCAVVVPTGADRGVTVDITPTAGLNTLKVWTQDLAGNLGGGGTPPQYQFSVRKPSDVSQVTGSAVGDPAAQWSMNEGAGTTAADGSGHGNTVTLSTGAGWTSPGHLGVGSALNGGAATGGPVSTRDPDTGAQATVRTDRSFTVAAWVRLSGTANWATAVGQDGSRASGFYLQYNVLAGRWSFSQVAADADNPAAYRAVSVSVPQVGKWTHLVGVYDAATRSRELRLYVNGVAEGKVAVAAPWNATGPLTIGRAKYNGGQVDHWPGDVDDVHVFDRVLSSTEIGQLANAAVLTGRWDLGEGAGPTAADTSGFTPVRNDGTLPSGASWADVQVEDARPSDGGLPDLPTVVNLDGTGGIVTKRPAVDTSQSFSVAAWVRVTRTDAWQAAVSIDGNLDSAFDLQYAGNVNRWTFEMVDADAIYPTSHYSTSYLTTPAVGKWTHLVGVYDTAAGQARLYVNGALEASTPDTGMWRASGVLRIGAAKLNGSEFKFWTGDIAEVRVYAGVLSDAQIKALAGVS